MKKKLISVILASALTVGMLSACGSDSSKDNDANSKIDTTETGSNTTKSDTSSAPVSVTLNEVAILSSMPLCMLPLKMDILKMRELNSLS